jgi:hypothetical protein
LELINSEINVPQEVLESNANACVFEIRKNQDYRGKIYFYAKSKKISLACIQKYANVMEKAKNELKQLLESNNEN